MNNKKVYKEDVWKIISEHIGEDNAINQNDIVDQYWIRRNDEVSDREIRKLIRVLREEGYPILSSTHFPNGGYFIPNNYAEVKEWQKRMNIKAIKLLAIVAPVIKSCQDMFPNRNGKEQLRLKEVI